MQRSLTFLFAVMTTSPAIVMATMTTTAEAAKDDRHYDEYHHTRRHLNDIIGGSPIDYQLAGYKPFDPRVVIDAARIDLDQVDIEQSSLFFSFSGAKNIYENGGHSSSVATLRLDSPMQLEMPARTIVLGMSESESSSGGAAATTNDIRATLLRDFPALSTTIDVVYPTTEDTDGDETTFCQVGSSLAPLRAGCFQESGAVTIGGILQISYKYDAAVDTYNLRSIGRFSTDAGDVFFNCPSCPLATYHSFVKYYGDFTYADDFFQAAVAGTETNLERGNANFGIIGFDGRAEAIPRFSLLLNIWMYVVGLLELAVDVCLDGNEEDGDRDPLFLWDEAFALYAGSLEGPDGGTGEGKLLYHLADEMCVAFGTCVLQSAVVNRDLVEEFQLGQTNLLAGQCEDAAAKKDRIVTLMTVPLIQGLLLSATTSLRDAGMVARVTTFGFAAAVLPLIHDCDELGGILLYEAVRLDSAAATAQDLFPSLRSVVEASYGCLAISCEDIGFLEGANLCVSATGATAAPTSAGTEECEEDGDEECSGDDGESGSPSILPGLTVSALAGVLLWSLLQSGLPGWT